MKDIIMNILLGLVQLAVIIVSGISTKYLYGKNSSESLQKYTDIAKTAVYAIEQTMQGADGTAKKRSVEEYLSRVIGKKLSGEEIDKLIEAAVFEMNQLITDKNTKITTLDKVPTIS
jgi:LL-H family phage holin